MAMIGIAEVERALRHPVEARDDRLRHEIELPQRGLDRRGECVDIGGVVVIGRQRAHRRLPAQARKSGGEGKRVAVRVDLGGGCILKQKIINDKATLRLIAKMKKNTLKI